MENKKYHLDVNLLPRDEAPIFTTERLTVRDKLLNKLFGKKKQYLIIVPSEAIDTISFMEKKGGTQSG